MYIKVLVYTQMKKESIVLKNKDNFIISIKDKAERNMANQRVVELISSYFRVPTSKIRIVNGHHHPHKLLFIDNGR
jgi:uncharacterized protein YggU (UPF0235/DUF167 family)